MYICIGKSVFYYCMCVWQFYSEMIEKSYVQCQKQKRMGGMGGELKENLARKRNLCLCRQTERTKHMKWAKEPGRVPCDWKKKQWRVPWVQLTWGYTWKSVDIVQSSNKSCWLTKIYFLWSINCDNMLGYLSLDIICSSKLTVLVELRSRKTVCFSEQIIGSLRNHNGDAEDNVD